MLTPKNTRKFLAKHILATGYDMVLDMKKSRGMKLWDSQNKRWILDFFGFFATSALGMNHPKLLEPRFLEELKHASLNKVTNSDVYTVEMANFVKELSTVIPKNMPHLFFIEGGALAVENALKTAFDWKVRKNLLKGGDESGSRIIHLKGAFHGRSGYTLSLTNTFDKRKTEYFPKFDWPRVTNPKITFPLNDKNLREVKELENISLEEIQASIDRYGDDIAAFIIEPIQAEGGDNHFRGEYLRAVQKITSENDILFIVDEVQSGMGITGKWWAYQHFDVKPDIMVFGKKTQVCGIAAGKKIDEIKDNVFSVDSRINSTWGGNIADMVRGKQIIRIMKDESLVANSKKVGAYLLRRLEDLEIDRPEYFSNARGRGLMCAIDFKDSTSRDRYIEHLLKAGLLVLKCGEKSIRFRPPLIAEKKDVDKALETMENTLSTE
jgi:L-lysine 6-transaminase